MPWENLQTEIVEEFAELTPTASPINVELAFAATRDRRWKDCIGAARRMRWAYAPLRKRLRGSLSAEWCGCIEPVPKMTTSVFMRCTVCLRAIFGRRSVAPRPTQDHLTHCPCFECVMVRLDPPPRTNWRYRIRRCPNHHTLSARPPATTRFGLTLYCTDCATSLRTFAARRRQQEHRRRVVKNEEPGHHHGSAGLGVNEVVEAR